MGWNVNNRGGPVPQPGEPQPISKSSRPPARPPPPTPKRREVSNSQSDQRAAQQSAQRAAIGSQIVKVLGDKAHSLDPNASDFGIQERKLKDRGFVRVATNLEGHHVLVDKSALKNLGLGSPQKFNQHGLVLIKKIATVQDAHSEEITFLRQAGFTNETINIAIQKNQFGQLLKSIPDIKARQAKMTAYLETVGIPEKKIYAEKIHGNLRSFFEKEVQSQLGKDFEALRSMGVAAKLICDSVRDGEYLASAKNRWFERENKFLLSLGVPEQAVEELIQKGHITDWANTNLRLRSPYEVLATQVSTSMAGTLRKTILDAMGALSILKSPQTSNVGESVKMQIGNYNPFETIVYKGKTGRVKFAIWSGEIKPKKDDPTYLGKGSYGIAQTVNKVMAQKVNGIIKAVTKTLAMKTPHLDAVGAQEDLENEIKKIKFYHASHPGGFCPGIQKELKEIKVVHNGEVVTTHMGKLYTSDLSKIKEPEAALLARGFKDMFHGLAHIHNLNAPPEEQGVHMDIKNENAFYDEETFLLGDFGGVRKGNELEPASWDSGTPLFKAENDRKILDSLIQKNDPLEILVHRQKMDVFAMGTTLWFMATGSDDPYYEAGWRAQETTTVDPKSPERIQEMRKKYGSDVVAIMLKMLDPDPNKRPTAAQCEIVFQKVEAKLSANSRTVTI